MSGRQIDGAASFIPPKTTHHSKRIVRVGRFSRLADTPQLVSARETWMAAMRPFQPSAPLEGPLIAMIDVYFPWRKGDASLAKKHGRWPCDVKPDCDNLSKTILDVMVVLGFFRQDQQVYSLSIKKWFSGKPGLVFTIVEG